MSDELNAAHRITPKAGADQASPPAGPEPFRGDRRPFTLDDPTPYEGKCVAWLGDGSGIRDADEDVDTLEQRLRDQGEDPKRFIYEWIDPPDFESYV